MATKIPSVPVGSLRTTDSVLASMTYTSAPLMAPPLESTTTPLMAPVAPPCPYARTPASIPANSNTTASNLYLLHIIHPPGDQTSGFRYREEQRSQ